MTRLPLPVTPETAARWRDHSIPQGIAHSYHRLCPGCLDEKIVKDEAVERENRARLRGCNWRRWAEDQALVGQEAIIEESERGQGILNGNAGGNEEVEGGEVRMREIEGIDGRLDDVEEYSDDEDDDGVGRRARGGADSAELGSSSGVDTEVHLVDRRRDLQHQLERLPTRGSAGLAQARLLLAELDSINLLLEGSRFAVGREEMSGRRTPGAERDRVVQRRLPGLPASGAGHVHSSDLRIPGDSSRGLRLPGLQQLMHARLEQRVQARRAQQRQRLENTRQVAAARRTRMFEQAQRNERRLIQNASYSLDSVGWSQHSPEEIAGIIDSATYSFPVAMVLIICYIFRSVQEAGRVGQAELGDAVLDTDEVRSTNAAWIREFEEGVARLAGVPRQRSEGHITRGDMDHSARSNSPSPESASAQIGDSDGTALNPEAHNHRKDCPHSVPYRSDMTCNHPTHLHKTPHHDDSKTLKKSTQHGEYPRPCADVAERTTTDTWEILIDFEGCKHQSRVFVEKLSYLHDSSISASCGCNGFDKRLVAAQRAISRQKCLVCRMKATKHRLWRSSDGRLPFCWFDRYVRQPKDARAIQLWPFDAKG